MTQFVVLAGGHGSRFFPFTELIPKCLLPIAGRPCSRWIIEDAIEQGFNPTDIFLCTNEKYEPYFRHEFRDLDISYGITVAPMGTIGELLNIMDLLEGSIMLRYGDDLTETNYHNLLKFHKNHKAVVSLVVTKNLQLSVGVVECGAKVFKFTEKPILGKPSWTGVCCMETERVRPFMKMGDDVGRDLIPKLLDADEPVFAFETDSHYFDVGDIESWRKADDHFRRTKL